MADDLKKRLKQRQRAAFQETRQRLRAFPAFAFNGSLVTPTYLAAIKSAFNKVRLSLVDVLLPVEMQNITDYFNGTGRVKQRGRNRVFCGINKIGDAAYDQVMKTYQVPVGTYQFKAPKKLGVIEVEVVSFNESKSQFGIRYLSHARPIVVSGQTGVLTRHTMAYTRHFLERAMERDFLGSPLERHRSLFRCLDNHVVLVPMGGYYRLYANSDRHYRSLGRDLHTPQQLAGTIDGSALYHFLGYVPISQEGSHFVSKTILLPGMSDTPEGDLDGLEANHFLDRQYLTSLAKQKFPIGLLVSPAGENRYDVRTLDIYDFKDESVKRRQKTDIDAGEDDDVPDVQVETPVEPDRRSGGAAGRAPGPGPGFLGERAGETHQHARVDQ